MDDFTGNTIAFTQYWQGQGDDLIYVAYLHRGKLFYYEEADDDMELRHRDWTDEDEALFKRQAEACYEVADNTSYDGIKRMMDGLLGIEEEVVEIEPEPVRVEVPEPIVEAPKPVTKARPLEREDGQMRLF